MILDSHVHLPSANHAKEADGAFVSYFPDWRAAFDYSRRTGIDGMIFTTWEGVWADTGEELESANREVLAIHACDRRLYPGVSIHPAFPACSEKWLKRFREQGFVWVGELVHYRANRGDYDSPEWLRLFELAGELGMIVQLHVSPSVIRLAKRLPELKIINVSSLCGEYAMPYFALYTASKGALTSFSLALAEECRGTGVCVTAVLPGAIYTRPDVCEYIAAQGLWGRLAAKTPQYVVAGALAASDGGKRRVILGAANKLAHALSRFVPKRLMIKLNAAARRGVSKDAF